MHALWVVTFAGPDRPGIVESISSLIARAGGNWEASRMARLAGRFTGVLQIRLPVDRENEVVAALRALSGTGLEVMVERGRSEEPRPDLRTLRIDLTGDDRPGIVHDVSRILSARGVNIEELTTQVIAAPMSGGLLFQAVAEIRCPREVDLDELLAALEQLADDLVVDLTLEDTTNTPHPAPIRG